MNNKWTKALTVLKRGELVVIPTDTIYGIVALALNKKAVEKLYRVRGRDPQKPCIILCSSIEDLSVFSLKIDKNTKKLLSKIWPNPVSVIFPFVSSSFDYLHRGTETIAVRIPKEKTLRNFLKVSGPIIAPSANKEGKDPAKNIKEAKEYFGERVGIYVNGKVSSRPSTLISILDGQIKILREGKWKVPKTLMKGI